MFLVLAVLVLATPAPQPTPPLKVIVNEKSTNFCSSVRKMAVPIGYVMRRNDEAFAAIDHRLLRFLEDTAGVSPADASDVAGLQSALDDDAIYGPTNDLDVMQMDKIAYEIMQNLTLEDQVMNQSWKDYPKGKFASIDGMRQRLQNLMDLQRSLANKYMEFTSTYLDNRGQAQFAENAASFKALLRSTILGLSGALAASHAQVDPEVPAQANVHDIATAGNVTAVVKELRLQELAFSSEVIGAGDTCGI
jgi:hypothetical protein